MNCENIFMFCQETNWSDWQQERVSLTSMQLTIAAISTGVLSWAWAVRPKQMLVADVSHWATASQWTGQAFWTTKQTQRMSPFQPSRYRKTRASLCGPSIHDLVIWIP